MLYGFLQVLGVQCCSGLRIVSLIFVGKLKKLELLKADYNRLSELTPAIGK